MPIVIVSVAPPLVVPVLDVTFVDVEEIVITVAAAVALTPIACKFVSAVMAAANPVAILVSVSPAKTVYVMAFCPPASPVSWTVTVTVFPVV